MKIEESFKDLKNLLHLEMILTFAIGLLIGESIRENNYKGKQAKNYSGLFIFLKHLRQISLSSIVGAIGSALALFKSIVLGIV